VGGAAPGRAHPFTGSRDRAGVSCPLSVGVAAPGVCPFVRSHRVPDTAPTTPFAYTAAVKARAGVLPWGPP